MPHTQALVKLYRRLPNIKFEIDILILRIFLKTDHPLFFSGYDGSACPLKLNPDGTYIKAVGWYNTEEWCGASCLKYNTP